MSDNKPTSIDRRHFLKDMGAWSIGLLVASSAGSLALAQGDEEFQSPGWPREALPGACMKPESQVEKILAAMVDTIVPGPDTDPAGDPGGLESCAINMLMDGNYPFREQAGILADLMDLLAQGDYQAGFLDITYEQRIQVLLKAEQSMPLLIMAYRAIRSAFFGGAYNGIGLEYMKYPGPNLGYRHIREASFRRAMCREKTEKGWMP